MLYEIFRNNKINIKAAAYFKYKKDWDTYWEEQSVSFVFNLIINWKLESFWDSFKVIVDENDWHIFKKVHLERWDQLVWMIRMLNLLWYNVLNDKNDIMEDYINNELLKVLN